MSIEDEVRALATAGAGGIIWLLIALGIAVVAVAVDRALVLLRTREDTARLQVTLRTALGQGDLVAARTCVVASRSIEARVVAAGLGALPRGAASVEERMASEAQRTRIVLERRLALLSAVGSSAPIVGLLGTVTGVVRALGAFPTGGGAISTELITRVCDALGTTAVGLVVAIPAVVLTTIFQREITLRMARAEALGREMLSYVKDERRSLAKEAA